MGLLTRLRRWWRGTFGRGTATNADEAAAVSPYAYRCGVCGTGVDDPEGTCPLCRSSDLVAVEEGADGTSSGSDEDLQASRPLGERHVAEGDDESVDRLRELQAGTALLERHADRWRPTDGGFRVETPDGETEVASQEALVAAIERYYEE